MRINTIIDPEDEKKAIKILRRGKGSWKNFVHNALNGYDTLEVIVKPKTGEGK